MPTSAVSTPSFSSTSSVASQYGARTGSGETSSTGSYARAPERGRSVLNRTTTESVPSALTPLTSASPAPAHSAPPSLSVPSADQEGRWTKHKVHPQAPPVDQNLLDDGDETCKHPIHPAYAADYKHNSCPVCLTKERIRAVRVAEFVIMNHKGKIPWSEQIQSLLPRREDEDEKEGYEIYAEITAQRRRGAVSVATGAPQGEARPHGGLASALVLGGFVGGAEVDLLHRHGLL